MTTSVSTSGPARAGSLPGSCRDGAPISSATRAAEARETASWKTQSASPSTGSETNAASPTMVINSPIVITCWRAYQPANAATTATSRPVVKVEAPMNIALAFIAPVVAPSEVRLVLR